MSKAKTPARAKPAALTEKEVAARNGAALARVAEMDDPEKLRNLMANAERMGVFPVRDAAFRRLALVQTEEEPDTIEHDLMMTVHAYEQLLREELGKAKRLTKTRMKMTKSGAAKALAAFPEVTAEWGAFDELITRGQSDLTGEAVILRHPDAVDEAVRDAAAARLEDAQTAPEPEPTDPTEAATA
ncbi:MAG: hypothetical protein WBA25_13545 [Jannaschia sp.]